MKRSLRRVAGALSGLTVEPTCFVFTFAFSVYSLGAQRLVLQKSCSPNATPPLNAICRDPEFITKAADINTVRNVLGEALPGLVVFLAGSWRDASGLSRPLLLYTIGGEVLAAGMFLLASQAWVQLPVWTASILESGIGGLSGGRQLVNLAAVCYISHRSTPEERTFRLTFYIGSAIAGLTLANAASGYVLSNVGYAVFFSGIIFLYLLAFILALIFVKEEPSRLKKGEKWVNMSKLLIVFKPRLNRSVIWLMIINCWLIYTAMCGESSLILFFLAKGYGFTITESGFFLSYINALNLLSTLIVVPFLIKVVKWSDFSIGIFGCITIIVAVVGVATTKSFMTLCLFASVDVMRYSMLTVQRSIITKSLPDNELGTFWSVVAIGEAVMPMLVLPVYDIIFKTTISTHLGAHYMVTVAIGVAVFVNLCLAKKLYKAEPCEKKTEPCEKKTEDCEEKKTEDCEEKKAEAKADCSPGIC